MTPEQKPVTGKEDKTGLSLPHQALVDFYHAFNSSDLEIMSRNWAQSEHISMDNPVGGIKRGWNEIREVYDRIFNGPAEVYVEFYDYTLHEAGEIFFVVGRERGQFRVGEKVIQLAIRTSRTYQLIDGRWLQVHHHGSIDNPVLLAEYQQAVRGT